LASFNCFLPNIFEKRNKGFFSRISSLKIGENEIVLKGNAEAVSDLVELKYEFESSISNSAAEIIDNKIEKKVLGALISIKKNTSYLWQDLLKNSNKKFSTTIRESTFERVKDDLDILVNAGYITYEQNVARNFNNYRDNSNVFNLNICIQKENFKEVIKNASEF